MTDSPDYDSICSFVRDFNAPLSIDNAIERIADLNAQVQESFVKGNVPYDTLYRTIDVKKVGDLELCCYCDGLFKPSFMAYHRRTFHSTQQRVYHCPIKGCKYTSPHRARIEQHNLAVHKGLYPFECKLCGLTTSQVSDMKTHIHRNHFSGLRACACGKIFKSPKRMQTHMKQCSAHNADNKR